MDTVQNIILAITDNLPWIMSAIIVSIIYKSKPKQVEISFINKFVIKTKR